VIVLSGIGELADAEAVWILRRRWRELEDDPMIFALRNLVCGKMERDMECAAALFHTNI
jgi:hypothetical protein